MPRSDAKEPITILGAGLIGICTGLALLERGEKVRLIDKGAPGQETSAGNAGIISPWSIVPQAMPGTWKQVPSLMFGKYRPLAIRPESWLAMVPWGLRFLRNGQRAQVEKTSAQMRFLCEPCINLYRQLLSGTGHEGLVRDSYYVHGYRDAKAAKIDGLDYQLRRDAGAQIEQIGPAELAALEPALGPVFDAAILIKGQARARSPGRIGAVLAAKFEQGGGQIVRDEIKALSNEGLEWVLQGTHAAYRCETVVLALGAWSAGLLKGIGVTVPLMAERGYHVGFPKAGVTLNHSVMDTASKVVASSMEDGLRVAGQAEFGAVDAPPNPARERQLTAIARELLPDLDTRDAKFWMGRRPSLPDGLPVIGELQGHKGLFCNFGHSHYGLMMAPKSGDLAADLIIRRSPNHEISALSPSRFT